MAATGRVDPRHPGDGHGGGDDLAEVDGLPEGEVVGVEEGRLPRGRRPRAQRRGQRGQHVTGEVAGRDLDGEPDRDGHERRGPHLDVPAGQAEGLEERQHLGLEGAVDGLPPHPLHGHDHGVVAARPAQLGRRALDPGALQGRGHVILPGDRALLSLEGLGRVHLHLGDRLGIDPAARRQGVAHPQDPQAGGEDDVEDRLGADVAGQAVADAVGGLEEAARVRCASAHHVVAEAHEGRARVVHLDHEVGRELIAREQVALDAPGDRRGGRALVAVDCVSWMAGLTSPSAVARAALAAAWASKRTKDPSAETT